MIRRLLLGLLAALMLMPTFLGAQEEPSGEYAAGLSGEATSVGQELDVVVNIALPEKKHLYSGVTEGFGGLTTVEITGSGFELAGDLREPDPHKDSPDWLAGESMYYHEGRFSFLRRIRVTDPAAFALHVALVGQICDDVSCIDLDTTWSVSATDVVKPFWREPVGAGSSSPSPAESSTVAENLSSGTLWDAFIGGVLGGLFALITPCVFPMIPITISFFMKQSEKHEGSLVGLAGVYCVGLVLFFTGLGLGLAAFMGGDVAGFANNPWINLFIGGIFLVFAFSFLGAFDLQPPQWLLNKASGGRRGGYVGALLMGFTFAVTSFTCTVPLVGTALALAVKEGNWITPTVVMLGFSGVIAFLFFFLALFPGMLKAMPKSGGWLGNTKVVMGFLELMLAAKFFRSADIVWKWEILSRDVVLLIWVILLGLITLYLLGVFRMAHDTPVERVGVTRILLVILFGLSTLYVGSGLLGTKLNDNIEGFLLADPRGYEGFEIKLGLAGSGGGSSGTGVASAEFHADFLNDYEGALKEARKRDVPLFIDFTGET